MASIYGNSTLTLAASVAANSDGELYGTPSPTETGVLVEGLQALGVTDKIFVREMLEHRMELFPLLKRAWAYQERLLSPRYLHFSPVELIWECNSQTVCMCSGRDIESERGLGEKTHGRFAKKNFWHCLGWNEREKYFKIKEEWRSFAWNTVVEQYSSLNITYRRDRLPAISGMAKQFRYLGQRGEYLAGLWRDTFLENMMWRASARSASMPKASEWVAPTWSWCSVGAGVTYFGQPWVALEISDRISLLGATCEHLYEDNTLNLKSASITLHGPAFNATVQYTSNAHGCKTYALVIEGVKPGKFLVDYDISAPGDGHLPCGSELLCLEAGNVTIYGEDGFGMHALVFRKLPDGRFERVGLVEWAEDIRGAANQAETTILTVHWADFYCAAECPPEARRPDGEPDRPYVLVHSPSQQALEPQEQIGETVKTRFNPANWDLIRRTFKNLFDRDPRGIHPVIFLILDQQSTEDCKVIVMHEDVCHWQWLTPEGDFIDNATEGREDLVKRTVWYKYRVPFEEAWTAQCAIEGLCSLEFAELYFEKTVMGDVCVEGKVE
ncbi:uncharacterized protein EI97DRAFT_462995 [Westerdykella ornata]|uniref:Heterokaryon incompatibility domain-containing protein n=1 Tax=Westerdykella ornata TaxID=318751 RepID=A0A6A6J3W2_WESOR|nr:uncharacterized protein EI97DRAFT_462995 [Westerdykella ornata]KAF2271260.1 hypothetical protein EI97DRAFT_462995 [Westerdykella ornata]